MLDLLFKTVSPLLAIALASPALAQSPGPPDPIDGPLAELVRRAVVERMGPAVDVEVLALDVPASDEIFTEARPDPVARLGRPVRFTFVTESGSSVRAFATLRVVADQVLTRAAIGRAHEIGAGDVYLERTEATGVRLRPLPTLPEVVGGRALRPIPAGAVVITGYVAIPRVVEPGDRVTVLAVMGAVQVTATFVASDGGRVGDIIRVINPDTRRYIKGRILRQGLVEVVHGG